ncbi:MAG: LysM peptidoglycan-binding domain-containing protein [Thermodesulfobacteriota bacterium]|nr:LysM peptidoglycan-binding domain-containing protein [Thermodesulfobacteriota bacterium]
MRIYIKKIDTKKTDSMTKPPAAKKYSQFLFIILCTVLMAGCNHSSFRQGPVGAKALPPSNPDQTCTSSKPVHLDAGDLTSGITPAAPDLQNTSGSLVSGADHLKKRSGKNTSEYPQTIIDNALAMCQSAQIFWEKGELDNALDELDMAYKAILDINTGNFPEFSQQKEDIRYMISKRILEIYASRNIVVTGKHNAIPITLNKHVKNEIQRFTGKEKNFFISSLKRSQRYRPYIVSQFKKEGLPVELSWLPLIESGFKVKALSPARALGLWQFIPSTGYKFGLKRNYYIDERLDPVKSTRAAIAYLKALHGIFGDWATVLAAYNCGEGRILRIIREQNINYLDNFWDLYEKLPRETARYVPRFLATLHILKNRDKYDINVSNPLEPLEFRTFTISKQIRLADIAKEINTTREILKELNPELRYALLPPEEYNIRIPVDKADAFTATLDKIKSSYPEPTRYAYYKVRRGDTLSGIARKYKTNVRAISSANGIFSENIIAAGKVLKIPASGSRFSPQKGSLSPGKTIRYSVKKGDNLWIIARRYNTTTNRIMGANNLSSSALYIGQKLIVPVQASGKSISRATTYWVKSGDNPFTIAKKYNMTLHRLLTLNNLTKGSKIYPGQKLLVE